MTEQDWVQVEYGTLRQEILALTEAQLSAVRFFLPAAAAIYTVPYLLNRTSQTLLWTICAGGAALMIMAMSYTLLAYVQGIYKIGSYIRTVIEPAAHGELHWETFLFETQTRRTANWPSEHVVISLGAIIANIAAALGAGLIFLEPANAGIPILASGFFSLITLPAAYRMWTSGRERRRYADEIESVLASCAPSEPPKAA